MNTQTHQPWKPTCWVGGWYFHCDNPWRAGRHKELESLDDGSRKKYAAVKATAAILRSMRK